MTESAYVEAVNLEIRAACLRLNMDERKAKEWLWRECMKNPRGPELDPYLTLGTGYAIPRRHPE